MDAKRSPAAGPPPPGSAPVPTGPGAPFHPVGSPAADPFHGPFPPRPPRTLARRLLPPLATLAATAAAFTYVGLVDPNETGHYPICPLYGVTGVYCPGCGGLRSAHAVAHGDLATAFGDNALAVVGYAAFAVVWVVWVVRAARNLPVGITMRPLWWWAVGAVVVVFSVVRNLPFGSALAP